MLERPSFDRIAEKPFLKHKKRGKNKPGRESSNVELALGKSNARIQSSSSLTAAPQLVQHPRDLPALAKRLERMGNFLEKNRMIIYEECTR